MSVCAVVADMAAGMVTDIVAGHWMGGGQIFAARSLPPNLQNGHALLWGNRVQHGARAPRQQANAAT